MKNNEYFTLNIKHSLNNNLKFNGSDLFSVYDLTFYQYYYLCNLGLLKLEPKIEDLVLSMFGVKEEVEDLNSKEVKEEISKYNFKENNNTQNLKEGKKFSSISSMKRFLGNKLEKDNVEDS